MEEFDATDEFDSDLQTARRDFCHLEENCYKEGFREGADDGRQRQAQEGFNSGYCRGVEEGMKRGYITGQLNAMLCRLQKKTSGTTAEETDSMTTFISELKVLLEEAEAIDNITTMEDKIRAIKAQFMCIFKTTLLGRP